MHFTQTPQPLAPLGAPITYAVAAQQSAEILARVTDTSGALLAARRFYATTRAAFDIAPILRRAVQFVPSTGDTGFFPTTSRTVAAIVSVESEEGTATATARTFLPTTKQATAPALLTTMPTQRLIAQGECEELTLLTDNDATVTVTAWHGVDLTAQRYTTTGAGLHLFRLDTRDFPGASAIEVDAGACGKVHYSVLTARQEGCRIAWRSSAGSIEHYTFPRVLTEEVAATKVWAYGAEGHTARVLEERIFTLSSAYESRNRLDALAGLLASPQVWMVEGDNYTPLDVVTDRAVIHRHGTMSSLEIALRPKIKTSLPWS